MSISKKREMEEQQTFFDRSTQILLPILTVTGFLLVSLKKPEFGLIVVLISQVFWIYTSYKAWKNAGQIGLMVTSIIMSGVALYGVMNYWLF